MVRRSRPVTVAAVLAVILFAVWMGTGLGGESVTGVVSGLGTVAMILAAGTACLIRAARHRGRIGRASCRERVLTDV